MKKCPHCGKELPQEMQFCPYCMEKLMAETEVGVTPVRRRRRWWPWIVVVVLFLLLLCGLWPWYPWDGATPIKETVPAPSGEVTTTTVTTADVAVSDTAAAPAVDQTPTTTAAHSTDKVTTTSTVPTSRSGTAFTTTSAVTASQNKATTTTTSATTTAICGQGHDWKPITQTQHVDEVGHYETKTVEKRVTVYRCALCYQEHLALEDYYAHFDGTHGGDTLQGVFRDRYTEVAEYREVAEQQWVVDTPAYDKTVTVGRRCAVCGKTETNQDKE